MFNVPNLGLIRGLGAGIHLVISWVFWESSQNERTKGWTFRFQLKIDTKRTNFIKKGQHPWVLPF